jgi:hypothetical protein
MTNLSPQKLANLPGLTDDLRPQRCRHPAWTTCCLSWSQSVSAKEARAWIKAGKETCLRHVDALTWATLLIVNETPQGAEDWADALRMTMPDQQAEMSDEELDQEEAPADQGGEEPPGGLGRRGERCSSPASLPPAGRLLSRQLSRSCSLPEFYMEH